MKTIKQLVLLSLFMFGGLAYAQVGIGTNSPNHALEIESTDSGLVIPRVANTAAVTVAPVAGTMVFDLSSGCIKSYDGTAWSQCFGAGGSTPSFRASTSNDLVDGDLNNYVIVNVNSTYTLGSLSPNIGDRIYLIDAGNGFGIESTDLGPNQQATTLVPGGGISIVYDGSTWWVVSAF